MSDQLLEDEQQVAGGGAAEPQFDYESMTLEQLKKHRDTINQRKATIKHKEYVDPAKFPKDLESLSLDELKARRAALAHERQSPQLEEVRKQVDTGGETGAHWALRKFTSPISDPIHTLAYGQARKAYDEGKATPEQMRTIAQHEQRELFDSDESLGEAAGGAILRAPGELAMFMAGGAVGKALTPASMMGKGVLPAIGRTAVSTAALPNLYAERAMQRNIEEGRDPLDWSALPQAYGLAVAEMATLGAIGKQTEKLLPGAGLGRGVGRTAIAGASGPFAQAATDIVTNMAGLQTGFGTLGEIAEGKYGDALKHAVGQAATFAAFHGSRELMGEVKHELDRQKKAGATDEEAARAVEQALRDGEKTGIQEAGGVEQPEVAVGGATGAVEAKPAPPADVAKPPEPLSEVQKMEEAARDTGIQGLRDTLAAGKKLTYQTDGGGNVWVGVTTTQGGILTSQAMPLEMTPENKKAFKRAELDQTLADTPEEKSAARAESQRIIKEETERHLANLKPPEAPAAPPAAEVKPIEELPNVDDPAVAAELGDLAGQWGKSVAAEAPPAAPAAPVPIAERIKAKQAEKQAQEAEQAKAKPQPVKPKRENLFADDPSAPQPWEVQLKTLPPWKQALFELRRNGVSFSNVALQDEIPNNPKTGRPYTKERIEQFEAEIMAELGLDQSIEQMFHAPGRKAEAQRIAEQQKADLDELRNTEAEARKRRPGESEQEQEKRVRDFFAEQERLGKEKAGRVRPAKPVPGKTYEVTPEQLETDPDRLQYKQSGIGKGGVGEELKKVKKWNPEFGGVLSVWRDPADGKDYVVNGHHRYELGTRTGAEYFRVQYIEAETAAEARSQGALINIAEGRGTAIDAAKVMRDTGTSLEKMQEHGLSATGPIARDAAVLAKLSDSLFNRTATGKIKMDRALAIGRELTDHNLQDQLIKIIEQAEARGKSLSNEVVGEMARRVQETPVASKEGEDLFGTFTEEKSLFIPRAEVTAHVREQLGKRVRDFKAVSNLGRAEVVESVGENVLDVERNKAEAAQADQVRGIFDKFANLKGSIADHLNAFAEKYDNAKTKTAKAKVLAEATETIGKALPEVIREATGQAMPPSQGGVGSEPQPAVKKKSAFRKKVEGIAETLEKKGMAGLDPTKLLSAGEEIPLRLLQITAAKIIKGGYAFADFSAEMIKAAGEHIRPYLQEAWHKSMALARERPEGQGKVAPASMPVGVKNESAEQQRARAGLPELKPTDPTGHDYETLHAEAGRIARRSPVMIDQLIDRITKNPEQPIRDIEHFMLDHRLVELNNALVEAMRVEGATNDPVERASATHAFDFLSKQLEQTTDATKKAGAAPARSLAARRAMLEADFSLGRMVIERQAALGRPLNPQEKTDVYELHKKIDSLQKRLNEIDAAKPKAKPKVGSTADERLFEDQPAEKPKTKPQEKSERRRKAHDEVETAWKEFYDVAKGEHLFSDWAAGGKVILAATKLAKALIKEGFVTFQDFAGQVTKRKGEELTDEQVGVLKQAWEQAKPKGRPVGTPRDPGERKEIKIRKPDNKRSIAAAAKRFAKEAIEHENIHDREEVIDYVRDQIAEQLPGDYSRSQAMHDISDYGVFKQLRKDPVSVELRAYKGEMQQLLKLEDMAAGVAPKKTGIERREQSAEERRLVKQVNVEKEKGGYEARDPARELKTYLETTKTRLRNEIEDMDRQIREGQRTLRDRSGKPMPDAEAQQLREARDAMKKIYDHVFNAGKSEAGQLKVLKEKMLKRTAELQKQKDSGRFTPREKKTSPVNLDAEGIEIQTNLKQLQREANQFNARERAKRAPRAVKIRRAIGDVYNVPRAMMAAVDFALGRQGLPSLAAHPIRTAKGIPEMFRSFFSEDAANRAQTAIDRRSTAGWHRQSGLAITDRHAGVTQHEEGFASRLVHKIPVIGSIVRGSERAFQVGMNRIRADAWDDLASKVVRKNGKLTMDEAMVISNYVNDITGRGDMGMLNKHADGLSKIFFAPRLAVSRFKTMAGMPIYQKSHLKAPEARKLIAKEYGRMGAGIASAVGLALLAGGELDDDWNIKFGNTRLDLTGGMKSSATFVAKAAYDAFTTMTGLAGEKKFADTDTAERTGRFLRGKLAPSLGAFFDVTTGKDLGGEEVTPAGAALKMFTPIISHDIVDAMEDLGVPKGTAISMLGLFGFGINTYQKKGDKKPQPVGAGGGRRLF